MASNVPLPVLGDTGFVPPATADVYAGVMADIGVAFGTSAISQDEETPQGQLGTSFSEVIQAFMDLFSAFVSRVDPATSSGRMQDLIGRFFNIERIAASPTTAVATCTGAFNTPIPQGALARTAGGDIFAAVQGGTIPISGTLTLEFQNIALGAVACPAGYLNEIYQGVAGWDTITNLSDGTEGTDEELAQAFEARRQVELTKNALGFNAAMRGAIRAVPGVVDAYVIDNPTSGGVTIRGVTIPAGAVYIAVYGGADSDVAEAIWLTKSPGTPYYAGNTTVVVEDTLSGYAIPLPTYSVIFERPAIAPTVVSVELSSLDSVPGNVVSLVQAAIQQVFQGTDASGKGAPTIGSRVFASRFYAAVAALGPWADIINIKLGNGNSADACQFTGSIAGNALTVASVASGALAIGQTVGGALPGTVITGGTGTAWTVSVAQTLATGPLASYLADQDYADANLDQLPGVSAADIHVAIV